MAEVNLNDVVNDAVDDAAFDASIPDINPDPAPDPAPEPAVDVAPDPTADPAADPLADPVEAQDEFEKRWGIPAKSVTGRENRIPHSRVKQMVSKAEADTIARLTKELETKWATERQPLETKVKDYEDRLTKVAQFEQVLENDPRTFLQMLSQVPAYKEFFDYVGQLAKGGQAPQAPATGQTPAGMPQPDQTLADGTKVYSMEGLQALLQWQSDNVEQRVTQKVQQQYAPIEQEWQAQQRMAQIVPVIEKQIAEARTWPNFAELEPEVIKLLKADQNLTLERAYLKAHNDHVVPKLAADRNKMRADILAELKQKPISSAAPVAQVRPNSRPTNENRSIEDIIKDSLREAGHQI